MTLDHRQNNGFTLVEIMVVLVIFGLLVAMAVPGIKGIMSDTQIAGASNKVEVDLHFARTMASTQRKTTAVLFSGGTYRVLRYSPAETLRVRTMPRGVAATATDTAMFYAWGLTDPTTITVTDTHHSRVLHLLADGKVTH